MRTVIHGILNGLFEELIVRGFLMTEIKRFTGSGLFAVWCSVAVQVSYHFYQGAPLALSHAATFLVFAGYYAKTNRLMPVVVAHIMSDFMSILAYALRLTQFG
jgi:membrane protease YdiL (CAAX protease family)